MAGAKTAAREAVSNTASAALVGLSSMVSSFSASTTTSRVPPLTLRRSLDASAPSHKFAE